MILHLAPKTSVARAQLVRQIHDKLVLECPACQEDLEKLKVKRACPALCEHLARLVDVVREPSPFRDFFFQRRTFFYFVSCNCRKSFPSFQLAPRTINRSSWRLQLNRATSVLARKVGLPPRSQSRSLLSESRSLGSGAPPRGSRLTPLRVLGVCTFTTSVN